MWLFLNVLYANLQSLIKFYASICFVLFRWRQTPPYDVVCRRRLRTLS